MTKQSPPQSTVSYLLKAAVIAVFSIPTLEQQSEVRKLICKIADERIRTTKNYLELGGANQWKHSATYLLLTNLFNKK